MLNRPKSTISIGLQLRILGLLEFYIPKAGLIVRCILVCLTVYLVLATIRENRTAQRVRDEAAKIQQSIKTIEVVQTDHLHLQPIRSNHLLSAELGSRLSPLVVSWVFYLPPNHAMDFRVQSTTDEPVTLLAIPASDKERRGVFQIEIEKYASGRLKRFTLIGFNAPPSEYRFEKDVEIKHFEIANELPADTTAQHLLKLQDRLDREKKSRLKSRTKSKPIIENKLVPDVKFVCDSTRPTILMSWYVQETDVANSRLIDAAYCLELVVTPSASSTIKMGVPLALPVLK